MGIAKVVAMSARPWKAALLSFETGGILGQLVPQLGDPVTPFVFATFYASLGTTTGGDGSLLAFNSTGILSAPSVTASTLAALRAESRGAALDRAVFLRQNAFYARYLNAASIVTAAQGFYGAGATAKPALLASLATLAQQQADLLATAYTTDGRTGVVKTTNSSLNSTTTTKDTSSGSGQSTTTTTPELTTRSTGQANLQSIGGEKFKTATLGSGFPGPPPPAGDAPGATISQTGSGSGDISVSLQDGTSEGTSIETGTSTDRESGGESSTGAAYAVETQTIVNTDYAYRVPAIESQAHNARAQISLIDQQFNQFLASQPLPNLATIMQNELNSIDRGVYQLQVGFLDTILMSPIPGNVTGIYKMPGDAVRPGEPVIRVEDNSTVNVVATIVYRAPIKLGSTTSITTQLFDASGPTTSLDGTVIALRGFGDDDQWELVIQCANPLDGSGNPTFPNGYVFDYDNTTMTIT